MIKLDTGVFLVEWDEELPNLVGVKDLYLDFETTSGSPLHKSTNPWHHCRPLGMCVTADDMPMAWYVPYQESRRGWVRDIIAGCERWINHNIKYDCHVANLAGMMPDKLPILVDTLVGAKLIDSDRMYHGGYGLSALSSAWCDLDIAPLEERVEQQLKSHRTKDYGEVPLHIIAEYGCGDAQACRYVHRHISREMPSESQDIWAIEVQVTRALYDMERRGLLIDEAKLKRVQYGIIAKMLSLEARIESIIGHPIRPHTNSDCHEVLCGRYGLPVLRWTAKTVGGGNEPSFDKEALSAYMTSPMVRADPSLCELVEAIREYRRINTINNLFLEPWQKLTVDGVLHATYNQSITTGRMSCSKPNMQQLNKVAKSLIIPRPGYDLLSVDYSQIEFRLIAHYIKNREVIQAYLDDPRTDFHQWVANMCKIPRKPAKNINFAIGYGAGKDKVKQMLARDDELMAHTMTAAHDDPALFNEMRAAHADRVYRDYHELLPELRNTSRRASAVCTSRGYIRTAYGRRRHLPETFAHRAFNSLTQGTAAEVMKDRLAALAPAHCDWTAAADVHQVAVVHDDLLMEIPTTTDESVVSRIVSSMEAPRVAFRVPIVAVPARSNNNWAKCNI